MSNPSFHLAAENQHLASTREPDCTPPMLERNGYRLPETYPLPGMEPGHASVTSGPETESLRKGATDPCYADDQPGEVFLPRWWGLTSIGATVALVLLGLMLLWLVTGGQGR